MHGYLAYLANDGVEAINGIVSVIYHRHSQRGGSSGQDKEHGAVQADHTDGVRDWSLSHLVYATGHAQEALDEYNSEEARAARLARPNLEEARKKGGGRNANYSEAHEKQAARNLARLA